MGELPHTTSAGHGLQVGTTPQGHHLIIRDRIEYIFKYEPIYIAHADTPQFDERFIGFGMTRNSQVRRDEGFGNTSWQVYEMYVAGYDFHILNNAFTSHWGFQVG